MRNVKVLSSIILLLVAFMCTGAKCPLDAERGESDKIQQQQQERILAEATAQTGMPAIRNFWERKQLKMILEMRDQSTLITYTYLFSEQTGKLIYLGESVGFGIPAATQYSNPQKIAYSSPNVGVATLPQADPNGLFSPASADGTWILLKDPNGTDVKPIYVEPRVIVSPFKLHADSTYEVIINKK